MKFQEMWVDGEYANGRLECDCGCKWEGIIAPGDIIICPKCKKSYEYSVKVETTFKVVEKEIALQKDNYCIICSNAKIKSTRALSGNLE